VANKRLSCLQGLVEVLDQLVNSAIKILSLGRRGVLVLLVKLLELGTSLLHL